MTGSDQGVRALEAGIVTSDADALVDFYVEAFGFDVADRLEFPQGVVHRLRAGAAWLKIYQPAGEVHPVERPDPWHRDAGHAYAALHVDDVKGAHQRAVAAGAESLAEPVSHRPGARYALIADPEGNVWELLEEQR